MTRTGALAFIVAVSLAAGPGVVVFPTGTTLPIRFLQTVISGRDSIGTRVRVQSMGAMVSNGCVIVPPYTQAAGAVTLSRRGRMFGAGARSACDSTHSRSAPAEWLAISAVLDTLEYTPDKDLSDSGVAYGRRGSFAKRVVPFGIAGAADVAMMRGRRARRLLAHAPGPRGEDRCRRGGAPATDFPGERAAWSRVCAGHREPAARRDSRPSRLHAAQRDQGGEVPRGSHESHLPRNLGRSR